LRFQTKVKKFRNEERVEVTGDKVDVTINPDLFIVVLERQYENALATFEKRIKAAAEAQEPLDQADLKVVFKIQRMALKGKRFARVTMTNPGEIPDGEGEKLGKDLMSGLPNMFLLNKNRPDFVEGGTSMPFCYLAYWNMGMKVTVENIVEDGQKKVRYSIDIPIVDQASVNENTLTRAHVTPPDNAGGIDLNDKNLTLDVQRGGAGAADQAMAFDLGRIDGLRPVVVQVIPLRDLSGYLQGK
jgi:hypothetical protein